MKSTVFHDDARAEFDDAIAHYELREPGLGLRFHADVEQAAKLISQYPQIGSPYKSTEFRRYVLGRFPYSIFYLELGNVIWISAVAHSKRKPNYWKVRQFSRE